MSKTKPIVLLLTLTAALLSACDPAASVLDTVGGPRSMCTDTGTDRCRPPSPDPT
jgi:hypothetical protein